MKENITIALAIWGAVVSTLTAVWSIFRDFTQRDRLAVSVQIMWLHPGNEDIFNWSFKNKGDRELTITHLGAMPHRRWRPLWLFKRINGRRNSQQWLFPFDFINGRLPLSIGPLKGAAAAYRLHPLGVTEIGELFAVTADGREWFADRSSVRNILASKIFQAAIVATKQHETQQASS